MRHAPWSCPAPSLRGGKPALRPVLRPVLRPGRRSGLWAGALLLLLAAAAPAEAEGASALRARLEAFAGGPVSLDSRLVSPPCPQPHGLAWRGTPGESLVVSCPALARQLVVPVGSGTSAGPLRARPAPLIRRGDRVLVTSEGEGFRATVEAIAEGPAGAGERILLRNSSSGQRIAGMVHADGHVTAASR
jgi:hypothetical protein